MNIILKHNSIDLNLLKIKKKINIGNQFLNYPIKYSDKNLIIQTPIVYIPFGINKYDNKNYIDISFVNSDNDSTMNQFKNIIISLNDKIQNKLKNINKKKKFITSYKKSNGFFSDRLRLSFLEDILIFNESKKQISLEHIKSKIYTKLLLCPQFIWEHKKTYGISWNILQIMVYSKPMLDVYSFIDDDQPNIDKYLKMYKCGVPVQAIKNKMKIDKLDDSLLDKKLGLKTNEDNKPSIPYKKLSLNKQILKTKSIPLFKVTPNDLLNVKLKKSKENKLFKITPNDLLNIKLKKTKQNEKPNNFPLAHHFINLNELKDTIKKIHKN